MPPWVSVLTVCSLSPNSGPPSPFFVLGERRRIGRNADPRRRERLLPSLTLGHVLMPLQGSQDEAAASLPLHFLKNVQTPDSGESRNESSFPGAC